MAHPRDVLLGAQAGGVILPVCDHYSGVEVRMRKSLALQAEMIEEFGACVFDASLDCEDGAPVGGEVDHANMVVDLIRSAQPAIKNEAKVQPRIGVRVHPADHPAFEADIDLLVKGAGQHLAYITVPKVECQQDVQRAVRSIDAAGGAHIPVQVLLESSAAVHRAFDIAAHTRVESISFGLMDFVSSHGGAIPAQAMGSSGQFSHPLVVRAKTEIAAACHAFGKVPSHCVVTEFADAAAMQAAARKASGELGYTRMWSIHPSQIRPILAAFAPSELEIDNAAQIIAAGALAGWAPTSFSGQLHDRASYRYYWQVLERAHATGRALPSEIQTFFH
jgi:citrate lyase subunit beta / citryl-CoA lyase